MKSYAISAFNYVEVEVDAEFGNIFTLYIRQEWFRRHFLETLFIPADT